MADAEVPRGRTGAARTCGRRHRRSVRVLGCVVCRFPFITVDETMRHTEVDEAKLGSSPSCSRGGSRPPALITRAHIGNPIDLNYDVASKTKNTSDLGDRSNVPSSLLRSSSSVLSLLFPRNSFAKAHSWKHRPFRATDTEHSGGDHICDLRRDGNGDGRPDRLGDCGSISKTAIAEPSTSGTLRQLGRI